METALPWAQQSVFLRRHNHDQLAPFHFRELLHRAIVFEVFLNPFQQLDAKLLMGHFSAAIPQRNLGSIACLQKFCQLAQLDLVITNVGAGSELDFLDLHLLGFRFAGLGFLLLFKKIFAEIHDSTYRRLCVRGNFDQVERCFSGFSQGVIEAQYAGLFALGVNQPHLGGSNFPVAPDTFVRSYASILQ